MSAMSRIALVALGSNEKSAWGDPGETVQKAMLAVGELSEKKPRFSNLYATPAFPAGAGPDFVNAGMAIFTKSSAVDLLGRLHQIETAAGRTRARRWGQRTLDLDLIAVGDDILPNPETQTHWRNLAPEDQQVMAPPDIILPHPRMQDRTFVLVPLRDVAPDWVHPILGRSIRQICADMPDAAMAGVARLGNFSGP